MRVVPGQGGRRRSESVRGQGGLRLTWLTWPLAQPPTFNFHYGLPSVPCGPGPATLPHSPPWTGQDLVALSSRQPGWQFRSNPYRENIGTSWRELSQDVLASHCCSLPRTIRYLQSVSGDFNPLRLVVCWCSGVRGVSLVSLARIALPAMQVSSNDPLYF